MDDIGGYPERRYGGAAKGSLGPLGGFVGACGVQAEGLAGRQGQGTLDPRTGPAPGIRAWPCEGEARRERESGSSRAPCPSARLRRGAQEPGRGGPRRGAGDGHWPRRPKSIDPSPLGSRSGWSDLRGSNQATCRQIKLGTVKQCRVEVSEHEVESRLPPCENILAMQLRSCGPQVRWTAPSSASRTPRRTWRSPAARTSPAWPSSWGTPRRPSSAGPIPGGRQAARRREPPRETPELRRETFAQGLPRRTWEAFDCYGSHLRDNASQTVASMCKET